MAWIIFCKQSFINQYFPHIPTALKSRDRNIIFQGGELKEEDTACHQTS